MPLEKNFLINIIPTMTSIISSLLISVAFVAFFFSFKLAKCKIFMFNLISKIKESKLYTFATSVVVLFCLFCFGIVYLYFCQCYGLFNQLNAQTDVVLSDLTILRNLLLKILVLVNIAKNKDVCLTTDPMEDFEPFIDFKTLILLRVLRDSLDFSLSPEVVDNVYVNRQLLYCVYLVHSFNFINKVFIPVLIKHAKCVLHHCAFLKFIKKKNFLPILVINGVESNVVADIISLTQEIDIRCSSLSDLSNVVSLTDVQSKITIITSLCNEQQILLSVENLQIFELLSQLNSQLALLIEHLACLEVTLLKVSDYYTKFAAAEEQLNLLLNILNLY